MIVSWCTSSLKMACPPIHNEVPLQHDSTKGSCMFMSKEPLTFNDLPQVVAELRDEVSGMKALLLNLQNRPTQQRERTDTALSHQSRLPSTITFPLQPSTRNLQAGKSPVPNLANDGSSTLKSWQVAGDEPQESYSFDGWGAEHYHPCIAQVQAEQVQLANLPYLHRRLIANWNKSVLMGSTSQQMWFCLSIWFWGNRFYLI